jgi:transposase, IS5 family
MKQTRKGNAWHFGMKLHVGTDPKGRVHSLTATHAGVADITQLPQLLHGAEHVLYGDRDRARAVDRLAYRDRRTNARRGDHRASREFARRSQQQAVLA